MEMTSIEIIEPLALEEKSKLAEWEDKIESSRNNAEECVRTIGEALHEICENRLYRGDFSTFEAYAKNRWNISKTRAYQLIESRGTFRLLSTMVDIPSERAARSLSGLTDDEKLEAGNELKKLGRPVTSKDTQKAALKVSPKKREAEEKRKKAADAKAVKNALKRAREIERAEKKAAKAKDAVSGAKAVAEVLQRPPRGGLAKAKQESEADATGQTDAASRVEAWWAENRAQMLSHPPITHDELVRRIIALI